MNSHPRYLRLLDHLRWLHVVKAEGYGSDNDPLDNLRHSQRFGVAPWKGALIRGEDKLNRWLNLDAKGDVLSHGQREGVLDTGADKMAYDGLALVLWSEEHRISDEEWNDAFPVERVPVPGQGFGVPVSFPEMVNLLDAWLQANYPSHSIVNDALSDEPGPRFVGRLQEAVNEYRREEVRPPKPPKPPNDREVG